MVRSRGGLDNFGLDGLMKDLIIWYMCLQLTNLSIFLLIRNSYRVHQAGGEFLVPSVQDAIQGHKHILVREQEDGSREIMTNNLPGPSSISNEMVREFL
jgi:hypothetical protein